METRNNYQLQAQWAKERFLTYDLQKCIEKCRLEQDDRYLYLRFLGEQHRICRETGDMQRLHLGFWRDANSFEEIMTVLDWLCDSREDRYITGRWVNIVSQGPGFHRALQEIREDPDALHFEANPQGFCAACEALGGQRMKQGDISYAMELLDGLRILVCFYHGDDEFPPQLRMFWDENTMRYIRYETTWYALGLLMNRIRENMSMETKRLCLRPWRKEDAPALFTYACDPQIGTPAGWPAHTSVEESERIIQTVFSAPETYAVCLKETDMPIGCIGLKMGKATDMTERADECELGYWLGKPYWGNGYIPEAAETLICHAFRDLNMRAIWCGYYHGNEKSRRVQEKLGFLYHHTTYDLDVPLLGERRTGHTSLLTKENWNR